MAIVIAIVMSIAGLIALSGLAIEQYPDLTPPLVQVNAAYIGANAINVEQSVATPLEQKINGVENSLYMQSINTNSGVMSLNVTFDLGSDPNMSSVLTQNKVSAAASQLPEEVARTGITVEKAFTFPMMIISLTSPNETFDRDFIGNYTRLNISDELSRLSGVGKIDVMGSSDYAMRIWVKPEQMAALNISVGDIMNALREQNVIVPGGKFGGEPAPEGTDFTYTVTLRDRMQTAEEFGEIVLKIQENGAEVKLKNVADVSLGTENYEAFTRLNSKDCAVLFIYQAPGSNAMKVADEIKSALAKMKETFPEDLQYTISLDTTIPIKAGMDEIIETLIIALILVILVVFIFLQDWRATLIPVLAIPVSLLSAFILFPVLGFSINSLSLLGLVLAVGIVVDDAIVVVEAVMVHIEKGLSPREATITAMKEVTGPVIGTTFVLIAVFIPVSFISGITGRLYQQFAITIAVSVFFSAINALTLSPALSSLILRPKKQSKSLLARAFKSFDRSLDKTTNSYMSLTNIVSRKLVRSAIFIGVISLLAVFLGMRVPGGFMPDEDQGYFIMNVQLPGASSLQRTMEAVKKVEAVLATEEAIEYYTSIPGYNLLSGGVSTSAGSLFVTVKDWSERNVSVKELVNQLNVKLYYAIKEANVLSFGPPAIQGLGNGSGFSIMIQDKGGNTINYLTENTQEFINKVNARPEIAFAFTTFRDDVPQRFIYVNREKALKAGVSLTELHGTIGALLGGMYINDFNRFGRVYRIYLQAEPYYRQNEDQLDNFFVRNRTGKMVPLSALVEVENSIGPEYTTRFNLLRSIEVSGTPAEGYTSTQARVALKEVAKTLPSDIGYAWNAMSFQEEAASGKTAIIFAFSLILVFLILAALYESWSLPFSVLLGTPFALFGAFLFLWISRMFSLSYENNIFTQISLVMLIALAAKNAILIVEFAKLKFEEGSSLFDAAMDAARQRFRPILMTVFSFILGITPLLVASGAGAESRKVMGMTLLGGILIASIIGVIIYPMLFIVIGKIAGYEKKRELVKPKKTI
ncbi:MAG: efflux RND transporter permease subunit [Bacteroidales bacterium]|nr:efflux RND transporter permease subunit [Bacteroidales bacterium]